MKCALCQRQAIEDDLLYELNPATNRWALMHPACWQAVYDDLSQEEKDIYQEVKEGRG